MKVIKFYPNYSITLGGIVINNKTKRILKQHRKNGYFFVILCRKNKTRNFYVHRLVAKAFIKNKQRKPQVNHIDGDKSNNHAQNLEWCTQGENHKHAFCKGLRESKKGEKHPMSKLTLRQVKLIRELYSKGGKVSHIAKTFNLRSSHVSKIVNYLLWKHI